jgi:ubiquinone/menaquinone biosynthesis C-methylase UbiE
MGAKATPSTRIAPRVGNRDNMGSVADDRAPVSQSFEGVEASVFDLYDELLVPLLFQPYADDLTSHLRDLDDLDRASVLEVAAGTGVATRAMADALPTSVAITATDLIPGMVDRARVVGTSRPVTWDTADAGALPYDDESFDVVVCQFGAMFFPSKPAAFAEAARVLRPGGRLELAVWDRIEANEFADVVSSTVIELFPDDPPRFLEQVPHSYHDPAAVVADLLAGGLTSPLVELVEHRSTAATATLVARAYCTGTPLHDQLQRGGSDRVPAALAASTRALEDRFGATDLDTRISALVATARKV